MILYFSATGNSEYLAKQLAQLIDDEAVDLFPYIKSGEGGNFTSKKPYVLVVPTYSWRVPRFISEYLKTCTLSGTKDIYVLMNYGDSCGNAQKYARCNATSLGLNFKGLYGIQMPENYLMLFSIAPDDMNRKIVHASHDELKRFANYVNDSADIPSQKVSLAGKLESSFVNSVFFKFIVGDKKFRYTDKCIKCGKCARVCVLNNITYVDGYPRWNGNCTHCAACIAKCPDEAIEYGKKSIGKERYLISKILDEKSAK